MLSKIKSWIRILLDPTMFKFNRNYIIYNTIRPCMDYYKSKFNDVVIVFDEQCLYCSSDNCRISQNNYRIEKVISNLYNRMAKLKNLGFKHKIIFAFYVNPNKYKTYTDFYKDIISRFNMLFIADYIILYGLKKYKIKVLKCSDNIGLSVNIDPTYTKEINCIIGG